MKNLNTAILISFSLGIFLFGCRLFKPNKYEPIRINDSNEKNVLYPVFKQNEVLIIYKNNQDIPRKSATIKTAFANSGKGVDTGSVSIRRCNNCDPYIELWSGSNIHTAINGGGVIGGSGGKTKGVGEDTLAFYSFNYINRVPKDSLESDQRYKPGQDPKVISGAGKDTIIVAVLDTGIDTVNWVQKPSLWINRSENKNGADDDANCYADDINGWNFLTNTNNIHDDNPTIHGSLISQYILNEFQNSPKNFVELMVLKTHDNYGRGDLFTSLCAINYAVQNGAKIINASWGFYYYYDAPHPYLSNLITSTLASKGVLFITAAGNQTPESDAEARDIYAMQHPGVTLPNEILRNLEFHSFYPATLSSGGDNVITVTTTNGSIVSTTQNHSSKFVDLGVMADTVLPAGSMKFRVPFPGAGYATVSGSSFATAIASGKIGAYINKPMYAPGINKTDCFNHLTTIGGTSGIPVLLSNGPVLNSDHLIKDGRYLNR